MTDVGELVSRCCDLGAAFVIDGTSVRVRAPRALPRDLMSQLRAQKAEVGIYLEGQEAAAVADSLDVCLRLGQRLQRKLITHVICGITGHPCRACAGVPCLGSRDPSVGSVKEKE